MRYLSKMYRVAWLLRSVDGELERPTLSDYYTARLPTYSAVPQGNAQDLIVGDLDYIVTDDDGGFVIL